MGRGAAGTLTKTPARRRGADRRARGFNPLGTAIRASLISELLKPEYRDNPRPFAGQCYVASEAYFHLAGGKTAGLRSKTVRHEGSTHWWLVDADDQIIDLTAEQFETPVPYEEGRGCGFLTRDLSKRAQVVIERAGVALRGRG